MSADSEASGSMVAAELRRAFDASFAVSPPQPEPTEDFLAIAVGGVAHAVRLSDVVAFTAEPRVVPLPGAPTAFRGVAGIRGVVVPVYDLASLIGRTEENPEGRYVMVVGKEARVALSFGRFEGYRRVPRKDVVRAALSLAPSAAQTGEVVGSGESARAVLDMAEVLKIIEERAALGRATREF